MKQLKKLMDTLVNLLQHEMLPEKLEESHFGVTLVFMKVRLNDNHTFL